MGIEKLLPKPSSFLLGGLAINVTEHTDDVLKKYHPIEKVHSGSRFTGIAIECLRDIPTIAFMYYSDDWKIIIPLFGYIGFTWFADRFSYYGMGGM